MVISDIKEHQSSISLLEIKKPLLSERRGCATEYTTLIFQKYFLPELAPSLAITVGGKHYFLLTALC